MTLRSLLAITDFSVHGGHALTRAALLCAQHQASLQIACFVPPGDTPPGQAAERLSQHALQLRLRHGIDVQAVSEGVLPTLEDAVRQAGPADLVVWDVAPPRGPGAWFQNHPVFRLLRTFGRPVIVVRHGATGPYRSLLVAVDFSSASAGLVDLGRALQPAAQLELFHAIGTANEGKLRYAEVAEQTIRAYREECRRHAEQRMCTLADSYDTRRNRLSTAIGRGDPARQILVHQQNTAADLIVVGKHPASAWSDWLFESVAQRVVRSACADVLVVPHGAGWVVDRPGTAGGLPGGGHRAVAPA